MHLTFQASQVHAMGNFGKNAKTRERQTNIDSWPQNLSLRRLQVLLYLVSGLGVEAFVKAKDPLVGGEDREDEDSLKAVEDDVQVDQAGLQDVVEGPGLTGRHKDRDQTEEPSEAQDAEDPGEKKKPKALTLELFSGKKTFLLHALILSNL